MNAGSAMAQPFSSQIFTPKPCDHKIIYPYMAARFNLGIQFLGFIHSPADKKAKTGVVASAFVKKE